MSQEKFMTSSIYLFLDLIVVAASGWLYWLVITKLVPIAVVGQSTSVYSLVVLTSTIVGLGLEYPLLKKTAAHDRKIVGSAILVEIIVTAAALPVMISILHGISYNSTQNLNIIAALMLISISLGFVTRYALLGVTAARTIILIDTASMVIKFVTGYALVTLGLGVSGVLLSFMLQALVTACIGLILAKKEFGFNIGNFRYIKGLIKEGIVNTPSILSKTVIVSLSVVLLASFGVASSEIGVFYIALMISIIAGGLVASTAYMVLPASSISQQDLTSGSIRIGISLTAPIISLLLTAPKFVLSLIGSGYSSGETVLLILAIGILPFAIVTNTISRFNYLGMSRKILCIGFLQVLSFIVGFIILVPQFSGVGAAFSILLSYSVSCIPALIWSEKILLRYLVNTTIAIASGWAVSNICRFIIPNGNVSEVVALLSSIVITLIIILALKNTTIAELKTLLKAVVRSKPESV